jgi:hypothetical protein
MGRDLRFSKSLYPSIKLERYRLAFMSLPTVERAPILSARVKAIGNKLVALIFIIYFVYDLAGTVSFTWLSALIRA